jgi:hypothetical protein
MDAEVSSANGTAPIGFGGQVRRRASNTASRRFESSTHNRPGPTFRQYARLTRGTNIKKPSISARAVERPPESAPRGCSPPSSQTDSWLRPRNCRRRDDVGGRIIIGNIRGEPLANDVGGEQTLNIGKAGQIAQRVAPSPGSAVSSVTSAHHVTR